jgi:hypothetical protein
MTDIQTLTRDDWSLLREALENYEETQLELSELTKEEEPELSEMEEVTSAACSELLKKLAALGL